VPLTIRSQYWIFTEWTKAILGLLYCWGVELWKLLPLNFQFISRDRLISANWVIGMTMFLHITCQTWPIFARRERWIFNNSGAILSTRYHSVPKPCWQSWNWQHDNSRHRGLNTETGFKGIMSWPKVSSFVFRIWSLPWTNGHKTQLKWKLRYSPIQCAYSDRRHNRTGSEIGT